MTTSSLAASTGQYALAIHGGAGHYEGDQFTSEQKACYHEGLLAALRAAQVILEKSGSALDAVQAAVVVLEDDPLFNAGKGAVLNSEGQAELDAAIMDGATLKAGSVSGLTTIKNPIDLARAIMDQSDYVMLQGAAADAFAHNLGFQSVPNSYFVTADRQAQLQQAKTSKQAMNLSKYGTVGAVAVDRKGNVAAATSTGGLTNKRFGRVGDTPIIGAGTYADNASCAVSATGHGEYFIRLAVARTLCALAEYKGMDLKSAAQYIVHERLSRLGGDGGVIAVDSKGNLVLEMNTPGMFRGWLKEGQEPYTAIMAAP